MPRRGATDLCGVLAVDKPAGMTSHDVVAAVRHATGEGRIGHAGTLDPMATGLLVVLIGAYTRLEPYVSSTSKVYEARIAFGSATDTDDAEGEVVETAPLTLGLTEPAFAQSLLDTFLGESKQLPPAYSAIKVEGRVAHRIARSGGDPKLAERPIEVKEARLLGLDAAAGTWDVRFRVSKGTYVRALARDIGRAAGTVAHLAALRRTASGVLDVREAHPLEEVRAAAAEGAVQALFADPLRATALPVVEAPAADVATGRTLPARSAAHLRPDTVVAVASNGTLAGIYRVTAEGLRPEAVFAGACA